MIDVAIDSDISLEVRHALHVRDNGRPGVPKYLRVFIHGNGMESVGCATACSECGIMTNLTCSHIGRNGASLAVKYKNDNQYHCSVCGAVVKNAL